MKTKLRESVLIVLLILLSFLFIRGSDPIGRGIGWLFLLTLIFMPILCRITNLRGWELTGTAGLIAFIIIFIFLLFVML